MKTVDKVNGYTANIVYCVLMPIIIALALTLPDKLTYFPLGLAEIYATLLIMGTLSSVTIRFMQQLNILFIIPLSLEQRTENFLFTLERVVLLTFVWTVILKLLSGNVLHIPYEILRFELILCIVYTVNLVVKLRFDEPADGLENTAISLLYFLCLPIFLLIALLKMINSIKLTIAAIVVAIVIILPICMYRRYIKKRLIESIA